MNLLEFLDRAGRHVSRKTFEKYKDEKKSFTAWEVLIRYWRYNYDLVCNIKKKLLKKIRLWEVSSFIIKTKGVQLRTPFFKLF